MLGILKEHGFQVEFHSHAEAILRNDFPEVADQLEKILLKSTVPIEEIIGSGGGETKGTQRLRRALHDAGWRKHEFKVQRTIDGIARESISHEVDHIARFKRASLHWKSNGTTRIRFSTAILKILNGCTPMVRYRSVS